MYRLPSTAAMSSMRPPMLAGPIPRQTKCFNIGSVDQLTGVGVGLGIGVAVALRAADGLCAAAGDWEAAGFCAWAANAPNAIAANRSAQIATISPPKSRAERHVSFIWGNFLSYRVV